MNSDPQIKDIEKLTRLELDAQIQRFANRRYTLAVLAVLWMGLIVIVHNSHPDMPLNIQLALLGLAPAFVVIFGGTTRLEDALRPCPTDSQTWARVKAGATRCPDVAEYLGNLLNQRAPTLGEVRILAEHLDELDIENYKKPKALIA